MYLYLYSFGADVDKISVIVVGMYCGPPPFSNWFGTCLHPCWAWKQEGLTHAHGWGL